MSKHWTIEELITRYRDAKKRDNEVKARGRRGWNNHAITASRLGQRIAEKAQRDADAKVAVVKAGLQELYYYYTHDVSIFREAA